VNHASHGLVIVQPISKFTPWLHDVISSSLNVIKDILVDVYTVQSLSDNGSLTVLCRTAI